MEIEIKIIYEIIYNPKSNYNYVNYVNNDNVFPINYDF